MGYCLGGTVAWLASVKLTGLAAAVCYYGGQIAQFAHEKPACPVLMHFGGADHSIPPADVEKVRHAQHSGSVDVHVYPNAGHGFSCNERSSFFDPSSDALAYERTLAFLNQHVG